MMRLEKYSASGNDFLIAHALPKISNPSKLAKLLCNRFEGIGADGLVLLSPHLTYAYEWEFYNSDGSTALMCGNASRCVGLYAYLHQLGGQKHQFLSGSGVIEVEILSPCYPYKVKSILGQYQFVQQFQEWFLFDTGVPHLICLLQDQNAFDSFPIEEMRRLRKIHDANVNIAYEKEGHFWIKTYERGVEAITLACGTGMASLVALLNEQNKLPSSCIQITPPIGKSLTFSLQDQTIAFEGEVKKIAQCKINLNDFGIEQ